MIGRISALRLNGKKCICVPLWKNFDSSEVSLFFDNFVPLWKEFKIQGYGKYLGFIVGPLADNREWDSIADCMREVTALVKGLGLPKLHTLILFNILAVSRALFVAQLRGPSKSFTKRFNEMAVSILGGPGSWVPSMMPYALKGKCGFPIEIKHIDALCLAVRVRTAFCTMPGWIGLWNSFIDGSENDGAALVHPFKNWVEDAGISSLRDVGVNFKIGEFARFCLGEGMKDLHIQEVPKLQSLVYRFSANSFFSFDLEGALRDRFRRREWFEDVELGRMAARAASFLLTVSKHVPPCVTFAIINTFFNGWSTGARFQSKQNKCYICRNCGGDDSLEHYSVCIYQWRAFAGLFNKSIFPQAMPRFCGLYAEGLEEKIRHACHIYAVRNAVNSHRARVRGGVSEEEVKKSVVAGYRTASIHQKGLNEKLFEHIQF